MSWKVILDTPDGTRRQWYEDTEQHAKNMYERVRKNHSLPFVCWIEEVV